LRYILILMCFIIALQCFAELPQKMSYQGVLTDNDGNPVANGSYTVGFSIHNNPGDRAVRERNQLWSETQTITVNNGQFRAILGSVTPLNLPFDEPYWLAITVNGNTMTPYSELTSVPFSFNSRNSVNADSLNGFAGSHYLDWNNMSNIPPGFADGADASGSVLYDAVVATSGGDYTSLEAAIAAGKKTIYVRKGTITNTSTLTLPDNAVICGESWTESIIDGFAMGSLGRVTMRNIKLTCLGGTYEGANSVFEHVWIETTSDLAITIGNASEVKNCYISSNKGITTGTQCLVEGNYLLSNTLNCHFGNLSKIIGNTFQGASATDAISAGQKCVISNNILTCSSTQGTGIYASPGCLISNNRIEGFNDGMCLFSSNEGTVCNANVVKSCGGFGYRFLSGTGTEYGVMTITGNIAWQPGNTGFYLMIASNMYLSNNSVYDGSGDGFFITSSTAEDIQINGNSARYCNGKGFNFYGSNFAHANWNISNNQAIGNVSDGFRLFQQNSAVTGNVSISNSGVGFYFSNGLTYSTFVGNNSFNNIAGGFYATGSPALNCTSITGNVIRDGFEISGQNSNSVISNNVFFGDSTTFGSPQTNTIINNNVY